MKYFRNECFLRLWNKVKKIGIRRRCESSKVINDKGNKSALKWFGYVKIVCEGRVSLKRYILYSLSAWKERKGETRV